MISKYRMPWDSVPGWVASFRSLVFVRKLTAVHALRRDVSKTWDEVTNRNPYYLPVTSAGNDRVSITERGSSFGYNNLVSDMRSLVIMRQTGYPVVYDATHSVQLPGGAGSASSGQREFVAPLSRAAVATGVDALFWEVHENPAKALCDGPNSLPLDAVEELLRQMLALDKIVR